MDRRRNRGNGNRRDDLARIVEALHTAVDVLKSFARDATWRQKPNGDPVTAADLAVDRCLRKLLVCGDEGWLSEETGDDLTRLSARRVWIVDPLDGTREFVDGIPEWCVSISLVEDGSAVAGGICNPSNGEMFLGSLQTGLEVSGGTNPHRTAPLVLASRSEASRGEWDCFQGAPFQIQPMGSVAYKMARVAAGWADATWSFVPKHEWDIAAGTALVLATGGVVKTLDGQYPVFNRAHPLLEGVIAVAPGHSELLHYAECCVQQVVARARACAAGKETRSIAS
jgi:myo-inositol-1(or 4)-monophosphatase